MKKRWLQFFMMCATIPAAPLIFGTFEKKEFIEFLEGEVFNLSLDVPYEELQERYVSYFSSLGSLKDQCFAFLQLKNIVERTPLIHECLQVLPQQSRYDVMKELLLATKSLGEGDAQAVENLSGIFILCAAYEWKDLVSLSLELAYVKESPLFPRLINWCAKNKWKDFVLPEYLALGHVQKTDDFIKTLGWCAKHGWKDLILPEYLSRTSVQQSKYFPDLILLCAKNKWKDLVLPEHLALEQVQKSNLLFDIMNCCVKHEWQHLVFPDY